MTSCHETTARQDQPRARGFHMNSIRSLSMSTSGGEASCFQVERFIDNGGPRMPRIQGGIGGPKSFWSAKGHMRRSIARLATFASVVCLAVSISVARRSWNGQPRCRCARSGRRSSGRPPRRRVRGFRRRPLKRRRPMPRSMAAAAAASSRCGYLVMEWGDPKKLADIKSATKGVAGAPSRPGRRSRLDQAR